MKQNILYILLLTIVLTFVIASESKAWRDETVYSYNNFEYTYDTETGYIWILAYTGKEKTIDVPSQINGVMVKYVASLGPKANSTENNQRITKVHFPEGIEYLSGLDGCVSLREVNIPQSVTEIGYEAFTYCRKLQNIELPKGLKIVGDRAFSGCRKLKSIEFPNGLEKIGMCAFVGCESLEEVNLPDSVTDMEAEAFAGCTKLQKVKLSKNLTIINQRAFENCESLKSISIPKKVKEIDSFAFAHTSISNITIPAKVGEISSYAFMNCKKLKKVKFSGTKIKQIGRFAFSGANSKVVFDAPKKCVSKYKKMLIKSKSFSCGRVVVR